MKNYKVNQVTLEEKQELEKKLDYLVSEKKKEIIERLQIARSYGDLSENSEYDAAKDEQAHLEKEIKDLTELLNSVTVIDLNSFSEDEVTIGKTIKVKFLDTKEIDTFKMVSNTSGNIFEKKITLESPFGTAVNRSHTKDIVEVHSPDGIYQVEILEIYRTLSNN